MRMMIRTRNPKMKGNLVPKITEFRATITRTGLKCSLVRCEVKEAQ